MCVQQQEKYIGQNGEGQSGGHQTAAALVTQVQRVDQTQQDAGKLNGVGAAASDRHIPDQKGGVEDGLQSEKQGQYPMR